MTPQYIMEMKNMDAWEMSIAHTDNFIEEVKGLPFSEDLKNRIIAALNCTKSLIEENRLQRALLQDAMTLLDSNHRNLEWLKRVNRLKQQANYEA